MICFTGQNNLTMAHFCLSGPRWASERIETLGSVEEVPKKSFLSIGNKKHDPLAEKRKVATPSFLPCFLFAYFTNHGAAMHDDSLESKSLRSDTVTWCCTVYLNLPAPFLVDFVHARDL